MDRPTSFAAVPRPLLPLVLRKEKDAVVAEGAAVAIREARAPGRKDPRAEDEAKAMTTLNMDVVFAIGTTMVDVGASIATSSMSNYPRLRLRR